MPWVVIHGLIRGIGTCRRNCNKCSGYNTGTGALSSWYIIAKGVQETLYKLYHYNHKPEVAEIKEYAAGSRKKPKPPNDWGGGGRARRFLGLAYALSFLCLLRFDEVLKIQMHDIEWISDTCIKLTLPFRKTNQFGG